MRTISLCSGIAGLELGLSLVLPIEPILFVERDPYCRRVLEARHPGVPIGKDLFFAALAIWAARFRDPGFGYAELLAAGFPCQPWSAAGLRLGTDDDRWLWPLVAMWIRLVRPRYVFLENVPGLLAGGLGHVLGDLAAMRFDAAWGVFSCESLGASHRRERVFILAHCNQQRPPGALPGGLPGEQTEGGCPHLADSRGGGGALAHAVRVRREGRLGLPGQQQPPAAGRGPEVEHPDSATARGCVPGLLPGVEYAPGQRQASPQLEGRWGAAGSAGDALGDPSCGRPRRDDGGQPGKQSEDGRFLLGHPAGPRLTGRGLDAGPGSGAGGHHLEHAPGQQRPEGGDQQPCGPVPGCGELADPEGMRGQDGPPERGRSGGHPSRRPGVAYTYGWVLWDQPGRRSREGWSHKTQPGYAGAVWAPGPAANWAAIDERLWPATEPPLCRVADGRAYRLERSERRARLKALGNSVSAPVGAVAWCVLSGWLGV